MGWTKGQSRGATRRIAKTGSSLFADWLELIRRAVRNRDAEGVPGMTEDNFARFAATMLIVGQPTDHIALDVFDYLCRLLLAKKPSRQRAVSTPTQPSRSALLKPQDPLKKGRAYFFATNHSLLPTKREELLRISSALKAAESFEHVESATFSVGQFIEVAAQLPDPNAYAEVCKREGHTKVGTAFTLNTLEYMKGRYRGVVGHSADPEYSRGLPSIKAVR